MDHIKFGRLYIEDKRDDNYPLSFALATTAPPAITQKFWYADGWWGDQGNNPHCTAYAWSHWLCDGPVIQDLIPQKPIYDPSILYRKFQENDGIPGVGTYQGSTIRAGAKVLKKLGFIKEYRWTRDINDLCKGLLVFGPVVVGTQWFSDMMKPDASNKIKPTGNSAGGHAYLLDGVDMNAGILRIKNSWGRRWGDNGFAYINIEDFDKLLKDRGDACFAFETKLNKIPDLNGFISEDINNA